MPAPRFDLIIVGGGLAGSLLLQALQVRHPRLRCLLIEKSHRLGGNHTWSFHETDLPEGCVKWLQPLVTKSWTGYEVHFPEYSRSFRTAYHSLIGEEISEKLLASYPENIRTGESVAAVKKTDGCEVLLQSGEKLYAETVVLARGWESPHSPVAWQKFVGLDVELEEPHGLERAVLMDARVQQIDGFRFFCLLPWNERRVLIEDTYYSHHTVLKVERIEQEIHHYMEKKSWKIRRIHRRENGTLPLIMNVGKEPQGKGLDLPRIGAESGFFHPVTGYAVPTLLRQVSAIADRSNLTIPSIQKALHEIEADAKERLRYDRILNRMLFRAVAPTQRYKVLSHLYRMPDSLIHRFYTGRTNLFDQMRLFMGRSPVPLKKILGVLREE